MVKVESNLTSVSLRVLRRGALSETEIASCLDAMAMALPAEQASSGRVELHRTARNVIDEDSPQVAPGQMLKHYAPDVPAFVLMASDPARPSAVGGGAGGAASANEGAEHLATLSECVVCVSALVAGLAPPLSVFSIVTPSPAVRL